MRKYVKLPADIVKQRYFTRKSEISKAFNEKKEKFTVHLLWKYSKRLLSPTILQRNYIIQ